MSHYKQRSFHTHCTYSSLLRLTSYCYHQTQELLNLHLYHKAIEHIKSYQVQRPTGKWFYLPDVHAIAEYYNTSTYSIYQLLTRSPKEIKGIYEIYESDNIKIKVGKEK